MNPAWSPAGRDIVFVRGYDLNKPSGDMDLFVVDAAGHTATPDAYTAALVRDSTRMVT